MKLLIIIASLMLASCKGESSSSEESSQKLDENINVTSEHMVSDGTYSLGTCINNDSFLIRIGAYQDVELEVQGTQFEIRVKEYNNSSCSNMLFEFRYVGTFEYEVKLDAEEMNGYDIRVTYLISETWVKDLTFAANIFNPCGGNYTDNDWHEITNAGCEYDHSNVLNKIWKINIYDNGDFDTQGLHNAANENLQFTKQ